MSHEKKTRENCERKRCCLYGKKGDVVKKINCNWEDKEACKEFIYEKCNVVDARTVFGSVCKRKKCCKYAKTGDFIKKMECNFVGEETCSTTIFKKCKTVKRKNDCTKKKMLFI